MPALSLLTEDEKLFRETVLSFAQERIAPRVREMDAAAVFDIDILEQLFGLGLMGIEVPEELGGQGGSFFDSILAVEALAQVDPSAAVIVDVQNTLVNSAIRRWGTPEQQAAYLPRLATRAVGSYALSEAASGSDAFALTTQAAPHGDGYALTGRKLWISNAAEAGVFLVFATIDPAAGHRSVTAFIVDRNDEGFHVGRKEDKLGIRASSTCELILDDVYVAADRVLGEPGRGYKVAIETLNEGRIGIGAQMVGLAQGAFDHALRYVRQRRQFGRAISEFQAVQFELAEMATQIEAARLLVYNAARLKEAGAPFVEKAAMAKYFASEMAVKVAAQAVDLFGGVGFTKDYPVEKLYRDAKIGTIYEGSSNMQLQTIARGLLN